jgi:hypothetical protein
MKLWKVYVHSNSEYPLSEESKSFNFCFSVFCTFVDHFVIFIWNSLFYTGNIPTFWKNAQLTCDCTWTGISPWDWKQYSFPLHRYTHPIRDTETQTEITNSKNSFPEIGPQVGKQISKDSLNCPTYFIMDITVRCILYNCYSTTFSHVITYAI